MDNISKTLDSQIETDLQVLSKTTLGDDKREEMIDQIDDLYRLRLQEKELDISKEKLELEQIKFMQEKINQDDSRSFKKILDVAGLAIPNAIVLYSVVKGFKFEATGVFSSGTARRVLGWIRPEKILRAFK